MIRVIRFTLALAAIVASACETQAGCGLLHRGGCSDPCGVSACGGNSACSGACGGACGQTGQPSNCAGCGQPAGSYHASVYLGVHSSAPMNSGCAGCGQGAAYAAGLGAANQSNLASAAGSVPQGGPIDYGPVNSYQVVMVPEYFTETRAQCSTEYQDEVRYRTRSVARQVPVEVQDYRTTTVMVPTVETKTVEYSVLVPVKSEKTVEVSESVPVWTDVVSNYTVRVPTLIDVPEEYSVRVAQLRDETFNYTVYVPQTQTQTKMQTVTNAVPVTKQRTIQVCRPVTRMQSVTKDYGHWEVRVEEVAGIAAPAISYSAGQSACVGNGLGSGQVNMGGCSSYSGTCGSCGGAGQIYGTTGRGCRVISACGGCGGSGLQAQSQSVACGGCGSAASSCGGCGTPERSMAAGNGGAPAVHTISRRVWVPSVVTEEVPVVENQTTTEVVSYTAFETQSEQVPYECTYVVYAPEQRSATRQTVDYVNETRTRTRKVVQYTEESRCRTHRELSYKQETRTITVPVVSYTTEKRTKEITYTVNVPQTKTEPFTSTRYDTVSEDVTEEYTVRVPVATSKEVQVQACRMVPKLVPLTIYPCSSTSAGSYGAGGGNAGCASCGGTPTPAPAVSSGCNACGQ